MKAMIFSERGRAADVLRVAELPDPEPGLGEVRVRVRVSGVNPTDWKARAGSGPTTPFPFLVPNQDGAGEIDAVGDGVDRGRIGQRVWLFFAARKRQFGTAGELLCLPERQAVPLPDGTAFDLGASLGIPALTAHRCLFADGPIAGRTVLVSGGAGAVGHAAIELAKRAGARVVATVSSAGKAELARAAGADAVVDYTRPDAEQAIRAAAPDGVDRIVEVAVAWNIALDRAVLAENGVISCYASDGQPLSLTVRELMERNIALQFVLIYGVPDAAVDEAVAEVGAALAEGILTMLPTRRFTLGETAQAHDAVEAGFVGKVLIDIG